MAYQGLPGNTDEVLFNDQASMTTGCCWCSAAVKRLLLAQETEYLVPAANY